MATNRPKLCVVTGALGNIGMPICKELAARGARVVMVGRDPTRTQRARDAVARESGNAEVETAVCDMASLASIRRTAEELSRRHPKIDVLISNAAAYSATRQTTRDGFELQLGTNHLAPFLLTNLLEKPLEAAGSARVVVVAMPSKSPIQWDDIMLEKKYDGMTAYGMSKAANLYFARELAERWKGRVAVNALHPGMTKTTLIREAPLPIRIVFALFASSADKGKETPVHLALAPEVEGVTGEFFIKKRSVPFPKGSEDVAARQRLWDLSARLVGLS